MTLCRSYRTANSLSLLATVLLLAFLALAGPQPVLAASDDMPPGLKEYQQVGKKVLKSSLPESLAGMKRIHVIYNPPFVMGAVYSGGKPLAQIGVLVSPAPGDAKFKAVMQERVEKGEASAVVRNDRTVYLYGPAVDSEQSGGPGVSVLVDGKAVSIKGKPTDRMPDAKAIRGQLLSVLKSVDVERLANLSVTSAMLSSGQIKVSGAVDATLQIEGVNSILMGGYTDTRWSISLGDESKGMAARLFYLPADIEPGTYELHEQPALMSGDTASVISAKFLVADTAGNPHPGYWDEKVTGTLTVDSVDNGKMTGHFEFKAYRDGAPPVRVKGQFEDLVILDGELSGA